MASLDKNNWWNRATSLGCCQAPILIFRRQNSSHCRAQKKLSAQTDLALPASVAALWLSLMFERACGFVRFRGVRCVRETRRPPKLGFDAELSIHLKHRNRQHPRHCTCYKAPQICQLHHLHNLRPTDDVAQPTIPAP